MTLKLTQDEFFEQFQEADEEQFQWDLADALDVTYKYEAQIAQGWWRTIDLREGISLQIHESQNREHLQITYSEKVEPVYLAFSLSGNAQETVSSTSSDIILPYCAEKYVLKGKGREKTVCNCSAGKVNSDIMILIQPHVLHSFAGLPEEGLPENLQYLVRPPSPERYLHSGDTLPAMATVLQQILHCPYQGIIKRTYLESKVIELMALVLAQELEIQQEGPTTYSLKPEQLERIHYAKEILLRDISNPPSLMELARQAGLNDFMLKLGFRQAFGTTVFGELRSQRLQKAKQLLAEQDIKIAEVAYRVGYASLNSFSKAFKREFGLRPNAYRKACR